MKKKTMKANGVSRKRRSERGQRVAAYLPLGTVKLLRLQCLKEDCSISDAITRAVENWLGRRSASS
jgi:hypothetical protein